MVWLLAIPQFGRIVQCNADNGRENLCRLESRPGTRDDIVTPWRQSTCSGYSPWHFWPRR